MTFSKLAGCRTIGAERRSATALGMLEPSRAGVQGRFKTRIASLRAAEKGRTHRDQAEAHEKHTADVKEKSNAVSFKTKSPSARLRLTQSAGTREDADGRSPPVQRYPRAAARLLIRRRRSEPSLVKPRNEISSASRYRLKAPKARHSQLSNTVGMYSPCIVHDMTEKKGKRGREGT